MVACHVQMSCRIALLLTLTLATACGTAQDAVQLSSAAADTPSPTAGTSQPASDPTPTVEPDETPAAAPPDPSPTPEAPDTAAVTLRTRRPVDGFDLDPPDGFHPVEYHPGHGTSMVIDGRVGGVRYFHRAETSESIVVAAWSPSPQRDHEWLERHRTHGGVVERGRPIKGTTAVWVLKDAEADNAISRTSLSVILEDGSLIWVSGTELEDASILYEFLMRMEDAPGSLTPGPEEETATARAGPSPTPEAGTPGPTSEAAGTAELALRTRRPLDGFDLDPPEGFHPVEYHPDHGKTMIFDGRQAGIRFYHRRGTSQSVVVAVWSKDAEGAAEGLDRYGRYTGDVITGRPVEGATAVWELRDWVGPHPDAPSRTSIAVHLSDGTEVVVNGTDIDDISVLYEFLTRIEDAPGSLVPKPEPGEAIRGGVSD